MRWCLFDCLYVRYYKTTEPIPMKFSEKGTTFWEWTIGLFPFRYHFQIQNLVIYVTKNKLILQLLKTILQFFQQSSQWDPFQSNLLGPSQVNNMYSNCYHFLLKLGASFQYNVLGAGTVMVWVMRGQRIGRRPSFGGVGTRSVHGLGGGVHLSSL